MFDTQQIDLDYRIAKSKVSKLHHHCMSIDDVIDVRVDEVTGRRLSIKYLGNWQAIQAQLITLLEQHQQDYIAELNYHTNESRRPACQCMADTIGQLPALAEADQLIGKLMASGDISFSQEGDFYFSGRLRDKIEWIDSEFVTFMSAIYHPEEIYSTPAIPLNSLAKVADLEKLSKELLVASHFSYSEMPNTTLNQQSCRADWVLPAAPCLKVYLLHEGKTLTQQYTYTTRGVCFRNESKAKFAFERMEAFNQRELVFIGDKSFVLAKAQQVQQDFQAFCQKIQLQAHPLAAQDPFFIDPQRRQTYDIDRTIKTEFRAAVHQEGKSISVASLDYHGAFFGQRCNIQQNNQKAYSACFGIGLERLVWACLNQLGTQWLG